MKRKVVFRADGNLKIGYGHFIRTLGIASIINKDFYCIYATQTPSEYQLKEIKKNCKEVIKLNNSSKSNQDFLSYLNGDEIVVLDNYNFNSDYQLKIKQKGCKVIYIDDLNEKEFVCDGLINNIPGYPKSSFKKQKYTKLYLGIDYALLRKEFFNPKWRQVKKVEKKIFLSFGGSDAYNISEKIIQYLVEIDSSFKLHVLLGDAYKQIDALHKYPNLKIHKNISANKVAALISSSSLCIVPASSLLNEVACINSKTIIGYFADNQVQPYKYFVKEKLAIGVGDYRNLTIEVFKHKIKEAFNAGFLMENQKRKYTYQQEKNIKNIFYNA